MTKLRTPALLGLAAVLASAAACKSSKTDPAPAAAAAVTAAAPVKVEPVVRQRVSEKLTYTGAIEAGQKITITPEMGGKVAKIYVEEGQRVSQGQLLAEMDTESVALQVKQAEAGLAVAEANFRNAARNKERMDRLVAEKAVSDAQYEQVKLGYDAAKAQLDQAQAAVNLARHALDVSIMKAPWAGLIASKNAQVGDVINPMMGGYGGGGGGVLTLVDDGRVKVVVEVSQSDIVRLQRGQKAFVKVGNGELKAAAGVVSVVNPSADPLSKKFRVEVTAPNPERTLRPGTFGSVEFEVVSHENALAVPQKTVFENKYVYLVEGGKAVKREVVLGLKNTTMIEVLSGLQEGEVVIVEGAFGLADGTPVEIRK
ncbi:MAG: efflux RND transporter periplasmic adaptor subunit [Candidatus Aminicenantes bacterium]|nr:efflux RND transporter periplasmic adaptor subunit [Candidatus Aminicenantes bacterium]